MHTPFDSAMRKKLCETPHHQYPYAIYQGIQILQPAGVFYELCTLFSPKKNTSIRIFFIVLKLPIQVVMPELVCCYCFRMA